MTRDPLSGVNTPEAIPLTDHNDPKSESSDLGLPQAPTSFSRNDAITTIACVSSFSIALTVVFNPRVAVYWGQTRQFIWVGLCLTLMGWCAQVPLRRAFLITSTNTRASTLQSIDAILRSDPMTSRANWRVRIVLSLMMGLGPVLSAGYKALGGGNSQFEERNLNGYFGLTDPPGTHDIGFGLSQFVNATLPWFKEPGINRVYGFNMHVANESVSAMLDGPMPDYISSMQASLHPRQSKIVTATVPAIVCELRSQLDRSVEEFQSMHDSSPYPNSTSGST